MPERIVPDMKHSLWYRPRSRAYLAVKHTTYGYILEYAPNHHFSQKNGHVYQHRLMWEKHNKAILLPWGEIHHINGKIGDNRIENLEVRMKRGKRKKN